MLKRFISLLPLIFFGTLLLARAHRPGSLVFDEVHYIPAAKALGTFSDDLNWVHPPLGKIIMALGWLILNQWTGLIGEPTVFRVVSIVFGLWTLWGVRAWMRALGYAEWISQVALILTGFNFLWFVQSKTAMLDIFFIALSVWGLLEVYRATSESSFAGPRPQRRFWWGWFLLGLAMAVKWSALPYLLVALVLSRKRVDRAFFGGVLSVAAYLFAFLPLSFLEKNATPPQNWIAYHDRMLRGMESINSANHPYISKWWKWPTLIRPMWYTFESDGKRDLCIWAGFNPALAWIALPLLVLVVWSALKERDRQARLLTALYWMPLLFWAIVPRKLQMFYYYVPSGLWVGPIVVWAYERYNKRIPALRETRGWLLIGFALLCAALFIYFLPIMDARDLPAGRYYHYMWLRSWI